jgi:predicted secreted Zn-dependent protease
MEALMRRLAWTAVAVVAMLAAPARAQTYAPGYPICLQTYGITGNSIDCSYTSMEQCRASASGRAAQCIANPYFAAASPVRRRYRDY